MKHTLIVLLLVSIHDASYETRGHVVIVGRMCIPEHGVLHQPCDSASQAALLRALPAAADEDILDALAELDHGRLWWIGHGKVVRVFNHL